MPWQEGLAAPGMRPTFKAFRLLLTQDCTPQAATLPAQGSAGGKLRRVLMEERARVLAWQLHGSSRKFSPCLSQTGLYSFAPFVLVQPSEAAQNRLLRRCLQTASMFPEDIVIWDSLCPPPLIL